MAKTFSKETESFLWDLKFNNERQWFLQNKERFENVLNQPFKELAQNTFDLLTCAFPNDGLELHISRIYRDARRLFGRGPYKDRLWFTIKNRKNGFNGASFFFEINPTGWCYGLGLYCEKPSQMEEFRKGVAANPAAFERLASNIEKMQGIVIQGDEYKKPKGDFGPIINKWYNRKYVDAISNHDFEGEIFSEDLSSILASEFGRMMPMYKFLNRFGNSIE